MSAAQRLLERLQGVRTSTGGPGRWVAKCPAHEDRAPSLSIRELEDGRVLLHCFGGCATGDVLGALGLALADLYDRPLEHHKPGTRDRGHWHASRQALEALRDEARTVVILAADVAAGCPLSEIDASRAALAAGRIADAAEALYGR